MPYGAVAARPFERVDILVRQPLLKSYLPGICLNHAVFQIVELDGIEQGIENIKVT